ncbi:glutaredoxin family protein [Pseudokineococcus sp. 5B2Z-1]|uniref:glutaredoxin family protein n=1 Tax=Pseudokineococcus sp. 5B2Z-1 TaxID=3132744 RepID=UPI0030A2EDA1
MSRRASRGSARGLLRALGGRRGREEAPTGPGAPGLGAPGPGALGPGEERVVLYGRAGCHLCADARAVVTAVAGRVGAGVREVDVDAPEPADEPGGRPGALAERYGELVPVVVVDGVQHAVYHVDAGRLEAALRRPPA